MSLNSHPDNPPTNVLPAGVSEEELIRAIAESGYPLQGVVTSRLLPQFHVVEEWGYVDDSTKESRSLDVYAYRRLSDKERVHPSLRLLIECKRSRHPFLFFQQVVPKGAPQFPYISGLPSRSVWISNPSGKNQIEVPPAVALGLDAMPFVAEGPPVCATFSKAVPSGKKVELSGADPFSTLVLPLVKAFRHTLSQNSRPEPRDPLYPTMELCIAVVDAPMLVVESPNRPGEPVLRPWVRVVRHESRQDVARFWEWKYYTIDVVHIDYLDTFIGSQLFPFVETFASRAEHSESTLRSGGQVPDLSSWSWDQVTPRSPTNQ